VELYLGIDGGGTTTRAILVEASGRILGLGQGGPSNYHNVGLEEAVRNIEVAHSAARADAGYPLDKVSGAFLGLAGIKSRGDTARVKAALEAVRLSPPEKIHVLNDLHNAHTGGLEAAPGIALIAGTGTHCLGRDAAGQTFLCGGWGWFLDDRGGAFGLAAAALREAVRAADKRGPETRLLEASLAFFGLSEAEEFLEHFYVHEWKPGRIAAFAPVVTRLAEEGDPVALSVVEDGASALAETIATTASALEFPDGPEVVLLGGCLRSAGTYGERVREKISATCPMARLREPRHDPVYGAAMNALSLSGRSPLPALTGLERLTPDLKE